MGKFKLERYINKAGKKPIDIWLNDQDVSVNAKLKRDFSILNVEVLVTMTL